MPTIETHSTTDGSHTVNVYEFYDSEHATYSYRPLCRQCMTRWIAKLVKDRNAATKAAKAHVEQHELAGA